MKELEELAKEADNYAISRRVDDERIELIKEAYIVGYLASLEPLKQAIIEYLEKQEQDKDILVERSVGAWNPKKLIEAVKNNDEIGLKLINNLIILSLDLFCRNKKTFLSKRRFKRSF